MKMKTLFTLVLGLVLTTAFVGCKKSEESATEKAATATESTANKTVEAVKDAANQVKEGATKAATEIKEGATKAAQEVKEGAVKVATDVKEKAQELVSSNSTVDNIIEKAKAFVSEGKYKDALDTLNKLTGVSLTEIQQKAVAGLKEQINKALASDTVKTSVSTMTNLFK